ncbi:unnamed protein product [Leuciscus chuanchicus]
MRPASGQPSSTAETLIQTDADTKGSIPLHFLPYSSTELRDVRPAGVGSHLAKAQLGGVGLAAFTRLPSTVGEGATWGLSTSVSWDLVLDQSVQAGEMRHAAHGELPKLSPLLSPSFSPLPPSHIVKG